MASSVIVGLLFRRRLIRFATSCASVQLPVRLPRLVVLDGVQPEHRLELREVAPTNLALDDAVDEPHPDTRDVVAPQYPPAQLGVVLAHQWVTMKSDSKIGSFCSIMSDSSCTARLKGRPDVLVKICIAAVSNARAVCGVHQPLTSTVC